MLPPRAKAERVVQVVVQPKPVLVPASATEPQGAEPKEVPCPPVQVDLTYARNPDGTHHVVASSSDGEILSARDLVIDQPPVPHDLKNSVIAGYNPLRKSYLAGATRRVLDMRRFTLEAGVIGIYRP